VTPAVWPLDPLIPDLLILPERSPMSQTTDILRPLSPARARPTASTRLCEEGGTRRLPRDSEALPRRGRGRNRPRPRPPARNERGEGYEGKREGSHCRRAPRVHVDVSRIPQDRRRRKARRRHHVIPLRTWRSRRYITTSTPRPSRHLRQAKTCPNAKSMSARSAATRCTTPRPTSAQFAKPKGSTFIKI